MAGSAAGPVWCGTSTGTAPLLQVKGPGSPTPAPRSRGADCGGRARGSVDEDRAEDVHEAVPRTRRSAGHRGGAAACAQAPPVLRQAARRAGQEEPFESRGRCLVFADVTMGRTAPTGSGHSGGGLRTPATWDGEPVPAHTSTTSPRSSLPLEPKAQDRRLPRRGRDEGGCLPDRGISTNHALRLRPDQGVGGRGRPQDGGRVRAGPRCGERVGARPENVHRPVAGGRSSKRTSITHRSARRQQTFARDQIIALGKVKRGYAAFAGYAQKQG
jgi:hypothetical protein